MEIPLMFIGSRLQVSFIKVHKSGKYGLHWLNIIDLCHFHSYHHLIIQNSKLCLLAH